MAELEPRLLQILAVLPWIKALPSLNLNFFFKMDINDHLPVSKGVVKTQGDAEMRAPLAPWSRAQEGKGSVRAPLHLCCPIRGFLTSYRGHSLAGPFETRHLVCKTRKPAARQDLALRVRKAAILP